MECLQSRSEMRKEQERERRRIRDRQRRQSMSLEEREKHLAHRRRNYQLRRQWADSSRLNPQTGIIMPASEMPVGVSNPHELVNFGGQSKSLEATKSQSLHIPAHILATVRGNLRLNRLKCLARSLNSPGRLGARECVVKVDNVASKCVLLRLNHVKRLARSKNVLVKAAVSQNPETIAEGMECADMDKCSLCPAKFPSSDDVECTWLLLGVLQLNVPIYRSHRETRLPICFANT